MDDHESALRESWIANAEAWTMSVRAGTIASRRLATDAAVVAAVMAASPASVLDIGCGEGWLARALAARGIAVTGFDASAALIKAAERAGGGRFIVSDYAGFAADPLRIGTGFDIAVASFALLQENLAPLLRALHPVAQPDGRFVLQTLHPSTQPAPYRDGWRSEGFAGFAAGPRPWRPMPWYFRTIGSWVALLHGTGWAIDRLDEPVHPQDGKPLSLLITARRQQA